MAIRNTLLGGTDYQTTGITTLNGALSAGATTATVVSTATFKTSGILQVDVEKMIYTGTTPTTFTGLTRGAYNTIAASHLTAASVHERELVLSEDLNDTLDAMGNRINTLTMFWINSDLSSLLEDFESYSVGAFTTTGNWTVSTVDAGGAGSVTLTSEILSSTTAGGTGKELHLSVTDQRDNAGNSSVTATLTGLSQNKHKYIKVASRTSVTVGTSGAQFIFGGASPIDIQALSGSGGTTDYPAATQAEIIVIAKGSNTYDVYINQTKVLSGTVQATPNLGFRVRADGSSGSSCTAHIYVDDIKEGTGSVI